MSEEENQLPTNTFNEGLALVLPEYKSLPSIRMSLDSLKEAERRLIEAKDLSPATYADLEHCFGEAYRDLKRHLATVGYQILRMESELNKLKSIVILDKLPEYLKDKPKTANTASVRDAYIGSDPEVQVARDRLDSLKAMEIFMEGRIKVMENVCRWMKVRMQLIIRSGLSGQNLYSR